MAVNDESDCKVIHAKMYTEEFIKTYIVDLGWESNIMIFDIYGKSGGNKADKVITETIIGSITEEMSKHAYTPTLIGGDFNVEPDTLKTIDGLIKEESWTDIRKHASK